MTTAAIATGIFSTALSLIPFVAIVAGLATIGAAMIAVSDDARLASDEVKKLYDNTRAELIADPWKQAQNPAKVYIGLIRDANEVKFDNHRISINQIERAWENAKRAAATYAGSAAGQGVNTSTLAGVMAISGGKNPFAKDTALQSILKGNTSKAVAKNAGAATKATAKLTKAQKAAAAASKAAAAASDAAAQVADDYWAGMAAAQEAAARAIQEAADREAAVLAERERAFESFADSVKNTFAGIKNSILGAFDLTQLGGSTNAITRNMDKLLVRLRAFATNVSKLSGMGLNPALLQQVISAGPMAGARLAESLVMGGTGALAAINAGYSEFGVLSGQIAQTGTESLFNREAQQTVYNINVDGGVGSGATIGKAIVDAIKAYERTSGAVWQGA
jgi:hypothetical protein